MAEAAAYQAIGIATANAWDNLAHDPQFVALQPEDPADMNAAEWQQWRNWTTVLARLGELTLLQVEQDLLPEDAMDRFGFSAWSQIFEPSAPNCAGPEFACVWPSIRPEVSESFRQFVEVGHDMDSIDCSAFALPVTP